MNGNDEFLGVVQLGQFRILTPNHVAGSSVRLTGIDMPTAMTPESKELDLTEYEGKAIMVRGHSSGGWIYSAEVIDQAGPILTAAVQQIFGRTDEAR